MSPYHPALSLAERQAEARKRLFAAVDKYLLPAAPAVNASRRRAMLMILGEYKALYEDGWE